MTLKQIVNQLDDLWDDIERLNPKSGLKCLGYWFDKWQKAYNEGPEELMKLKEEVDKLTEEDDYPGVLGLIKALLDSPKEIEVSGSIQKETINGE